LGPLWSRTGSNKEDWMSKFKLRHANLLLSIAALVALVVDAGAGFKF
jgi:hypothetical protein